MGLGYVLLDIAQTHSPSLAQHAMSRSNSPYVVALAPSGDRAVACCRDLVGCMWSGEPPPLYTWGTPQRAQPPHGVRAVYQGVRTPTLGGECIQQNQLQVPCAEQGYRGVYTARSLAVTTVTGMTYWNSECTCDASTSRCGRCVPILRRVCPINLDTFVKQNMQIPSKLTLSA